jgi:hypothetical protein
MTIHDARIILVAVGAAWLWGCDRADRSPSEAGHSSTEETAIQTEGVESEPSMPEASPGAAQARPATASPTEPARGRPPHPAIPPPIEEAQPSASTLASTGYRWLPGHWIWSGNQYVWQPGIWVYELPGYVLLPPQWRWDGEYWTFRDAGWALPGSDQAVYRPTALPDGSARVLPTPDPDEAQVDLEVSPSSYAAYVWTGTWVAPPIVYPSDTEGGVPTSRYARRIKPRPSPEPSPEVAAPTDYGRATSQGVVQQSTPPASTQADDEPVEYIPGVLHGGKRGEEELRLMQEEQEREAAEQAKSREAVFVPYYWSYPPYYPAWPAWPVYPVWPPHPPKPKPGPGRPPHHHAPHPHPSHPRPPHPGPR